MDKFQYFTPDIPQKRFGAYITVAGSESYGKGATFPLTRHNSYYYFTWNNGRKLEGKEYQLLYIRSGRGVVQFNRGEDIPLKAGSVNILRPGEWHRHRPDPDEGWSEAYIGVGGDIVERVVCELFPQNVPIVLSVDSDIHFDDEVMSLIGEILAAGSERPHVLAMKTLSLIVSLKERMSPPRGRATSYSAIRRACLIIGHRLGETIDLDSLARQVGMSYSLFRLRFRECTGMSPLAYQLSLRIRRARHLLESTEMPIAEMARALGFHSPAYFTRFFHKAQGCSPKEYRCVQFRNPPGVIVCPISSLRP